WMHREFDRDAAGIANAGAHALRQLQMMAIAWAEIGAGLSDADDRAAGGQFGAREAIIEIAFEIERRHSRIVGIVEPQLRPQARLRSVPSAFVSWHCLLRSIRAAQSVHCRKCLQCNFRRTMVVGSVDI